MEIYTQGGWLEVITGCMFSGKTEELVRRLRRAKIAKRRVFAIKPKIDNRYDEKDVVSHSGFRFNAMPVTSIDEIEDKAVDFDVIGIDEVQFFDDKIIQLINKLRKEGKRIIVSGLDTDFRGEPFGNMPILLAIADEVTKLYAICSVCGAPATRTQRLIDGKPAKYSDPIILVGGKEAYEARCNRHHEVILD